MKKILSGFFLGSFLLLSQFSMAQNLVINEYMASNNSAFADNYGQYDDWIEVYNAGTSEIDIAGLYFTDNLMLPVNFQIPYGNDSTKIAPGEYLVLWADNDPEQGILHLGFNLNGNGEQIGIFDGSGNVIDSLTYTEAFTDVSTGRYPDATGSWYSYHPGTPGSANNSDYLAASFYEQIFPPTANVSKELMIFSNLAWQISNPVSWISLVPSSGTGTTTVTLTVTEANPGTTDRTAVLSLSASGLPGQEITITQAGEPILPYLFINEFMADNQNGLTDAAGEREDWIEIYNASNQAVDLSGMYLSDNKNDPEKFRIPDTYPDSVTIAPLGFLVFFADNDEEQGVRHCGFKLSKNGEEVLLSVNEFGIIDSLTYHQQYPDLSYGRTWDGGPNWTYFDVPTPGISNANDVDEISQSTVSIFPNPCSDFLMIECSEPFYTWTMFTPAGVKLFDGNSGMESNAVNLSALEVGMYLIKIATSSGFYVKKLVKN